MPDITTSQPIKTFMQSEDQAAMQAALGPLTQSINDQTAESNYTLALSDAQKLVLMNASAPLTIPANSDVSFPVGTWVDVNCTGGSNYNSTAIVAASGVTLAWSNGQASGAAVFGSQTARLHKTGTNAWVFTMSQIVTGDAGALLKSTGDTWLGPATPGTDYAAPTSGSSLLKGNGAGGFSDGSGDVTITLAQANSGITPAPDGSYGNPTSITIVKGIITAIS